MIAMARYVCARCFVSQRWIPPLTLFALVSAVLYSSSGDALGTGAIGALLLLPVSAWMSAAALNMDGPSQVAVVTASLGGYLRGRAAIVLTTAVVSVSIGLPGIAIALLSDPHHGGVTGPVGTSGLLLVATSMTTAAGVVLGQLCARPIIRRPGFSWLVAIFASVMAIAVPGSPFGSLLKLLSAPNTSPSLREVSYLGLSTLVAAGVLFAALLWVSRRLER